MFYAAYALSKGKKHSSFILGVDGNKRTIGLRYLHFYQNLKTVRLCSEEKIHGSILGLSKFVKSGLANLV